jgi:hypothetical protein
MANQVIKKYKGEKAVQRGIAEMERKGYEVDQMASRKALYSVATGVFTPKQIHTVVFRKTSSAAAGPANPEPEFRAKDGWARQTAAITFLREATGLGPKEIGSAAKARGLKTNEVDKLAELYLAGEAPELGTPHDGAEATSVPAASAPVQAVGSVADELAKLAALRDSGVLSEDEFEAQKAKLLAG